MNTLITYPNFPVYVVLFAIMLAVAIWIMLDVKYSNVTIGFCPKGDDTTSHGKIFLQGKNGLHVMPFIADDPEKLILPSKTVLESIFQQVQKMGYEPVSLEIHYGVNRAVYYREHHSPVLVQPL